MEEGATYYLRGLFRQGNSTLARRYLGIQDSNGYNLLTNFDSSVVNVGYIVQNTPVWNDVRIPMSSLRAGAGAPSPQNFMGTIRAYQFRNGFTERLEFELQVPHGFNQNPLYGIRLHVHWSCSSITSPNTVGWFVDATVANIGAVFSAPQTYGPATGLTTVGNQHVVTSIVTFTGLTESAVIVGNVYRNIADTYAGNDVFGLSLDAHYVVQQLGSPSEIP